MPAAAFAVVRKAGEFAILRPEFQEPLLRVLGLQGAPMAPVGEVAGRQRYPVFAFPDGTRAILKHCRRGGLAGRLLGDLFFGLRRPVREFMLADRAARRGVPTAALLAARVRSVATLFYRGDLVVREIPGARDLGAAMDAPPAGPRERNQLLKAAASAVRRMHDAGLWHADLNLKNILVAAEGAGTAAYVIDLDRATLRQGPLGPADRAGNLRRLARSYAKAGGDLSAATGRRFLAAYCGRDKALRAQMRERLKRTDFPLHRLRWRLEGRP